MTIKLTYHTAEQLLQDACKSVVQLRNSWTETPKVSEWLPGDDYDVSVHSYRTPAEEYEVKETITPDSGIKPGKYAIAIAILDPAGMLPSLRFASMNYYNGGRHPMGYVGVGEDILEYKISSTEFDDIQNDHSLRYVVEK